MINVLVVHKEENMRELIKYMVLARGGGAVMTANNTGRALAWIRDQPINLAIVDFATIWPDCGVFAESAKMFRQNVVIALAVDDPDEGSEGIDVKFKMMDLHVRLGEFLAMADHKPPIEMAE